MAQITMAVESPDPPEKYTILPAQFEIEVSPGRTEVLNGTIQEAFAQAVALNPDFKLPVPTDKVAGAAEGVNGLVGEVAGGVTGPADRKRATRVICGNFPSADRGRAIEAIQYLMTLTTAPRMGSGPGVCARVSCTNNAAVYWCNDNHGVKLLDRWEMIAQSAGFIVNTCASVATTVGGQNFESGNWNSIVRGDSC
ncbi:uncharacterized protein C8A04DRAFT_29246 [Dichotomopilus funicola]|uniref:Uncharacterized protein n=1 Tax=Dichotomopilus funicola TaxID=1934379 RepID=A0AAN6V237_9PEZI|nr:hypothetical protein C8A04DRAFT_29246 [Dichotomopilus funicola]